MRRVLALGVVGAVISASPARADDEPRRPLAPTFPSVERVPLSTPGRGPSTPPSLIDWDAHPRIEGRIALELLGGVALATVTAGILFLPFTMLVWAPCDNLYPQCQNKPNVALNLMLGAVAVAASLGTGIVGLGLGEKASPSRIALTAAFSLMLMAVEIGVAHPFGNYPGSSDAHLGLIGAGILGSVIGVEISRRLPGIGRVRASVTPAGLVAAF